MKKNFYITAAIPYINAKPHLGHVLEWFQADTIARWQRMQGKNVTFACGTDENSLKNVQAAEASGSTTQAWLDSYALLYEQAFRDFNISVTHFRRGSDQVLHWPGVQALWQRCVAAGDIYTKEYEGLYCVGCESYYTPEELVQGKCPEHLRPAELIKETNYFFRLSKYQEQIKKLLSSNTVRVLDDQFKQEMLGFLAGGLEDFSVSRSISRARGVGVPVPNDPTQAMYVWFDALSVYLTAVGWNIQLEEFAKNWPADVHCIGKGITRFHALYWLGMLLSADLPLPQVISVHGYLTIEGQKMSKSLGNSINPYDLVNTFGLEPIRYYLLRAIPTHGDGDYSESAFKELYTAELANGLGNLCSRVAKLASDCQISPSTPKPEKNFSLAMNAYSLDRALQLIVSTIATTDKWLATTTPWKATPEKKRELVQQAVESVRTIIWMIEPFLPETATKLRAHFNQQHISALEPVFPRIS